MIDIDKELNEYIEKKRQEAKAENTIKNSDLIDIFGELKKTNKKLALTSLSTQQQIEKIQQENERLYKASLEILEKENLDYRNKLKECEKEQKLFISKIISIVDEFYRLKHYADASGNEKLSNTLNNNLKFIKKELSDINLEVMQVLGEFFNDNYHDCVEVREDLSKAQFEIVEEIKAGFTYKGKVVRPAEVAVVKNKGEGNNE